MHDLLQGSCRPLHHTQAIVIDSQFTEMCALVYGPVFSGRPNMDVHLRLLPGVFTLIPVLCTRLLCVHFIACWRFRACLRVCLNAGLKASLVACLIACLGTCLGAYLNACMRVPHLRAVLERAVLKSHAWDSCISGGVQCSTGRFWLTENSKCVAGLMLTLT